MKTMLKLNSALAILLIALFTGCSGITETTLPDTETTFESADIPVVHSELPGFFNTGEQETIIQNERRDRYKDRE